MIKKLIAAAFASSFLLFGCVNPQHTASNPSLTSASETITLGYNQFPSSMDPAKDYNGWYGVRYGVVETLFQLNDSLEVTPWLATSAQQLSETTWKITLKDSITFQNGKNMTAQDVQQSLLRIGSLNERADAELLIQSIEASGNELLITTKKPNPTLLNALAEPYSAIIDTTDLATVDAAPVGTGPYRVVEFKQEMRVSLEAYEHYWKGKPKTASISVVYYTDVNALSLALQAGDVDAAFSLPYTAVATYHANDEYSVSESPATRVIQFLYNYDKPIFQLTAFRQALDHLVDKNMYTSVLFNGSAQIANGAFPSNLPFSIPASSSTFDVARATQLLDEAGLIDSNQDGIREFNGENISLNLVTYNRLAEMPLAMQAFQQQLREVGINSTITTADKIGTTLKENEFDISTYSMIAAPTGDPYAYYQAMVSSNGVSNYGHYKNETVDQLIQQLEQTFSTQERNTLSQRIQETLNAEYAFVYIGHLKMPIVMKKTIQHLTSHTSDYYHVTHLIEKRN